MKETGYLILSRLSKERKCNLACTVASTHKLSKSSQVIMVNQHDVIRNRAFALWQDAFSQPRWHFKHLSGPGAALTPCASKAIQAGASTVSVSYDDDMQGHISQDRQHITIDDNTHDLVLVPRVKKEAIEIAEGNTSIHLNIAQFLSEIEITTGISADRINVHIDSTGLVDLAVAPTSSWVDPLIRCCAFDPVCVQQFIVNHNIGNIAPAVLNRLFGPGQFAQPPTGTADALAPFLSPVNIMLDDDLVFTLTYMHTVFDLLNLIGAKKVYLHGVHLERCALCLWTLSPIGFGAIYLYTKAPRQKVLRTTIGTQFMLPKRHSKRAFVPGMYSFTLNAFAPALRHTPSDLAKRYPGKPTCVFINNICHGEPLTVSRAMCIFRHLRFKVDNELLKTTLLSMALKNQGVTMSFYLNNMYPLPVSHYFEQYVQAVAENL